MFYLMGLLFPVNLQLLLQVVSFVPRLHSFERLARNFAAEVDGFEPAKQKFTLEKQVLKKATI